MGICNLGKEDFEQYLNSIKAKFNSDTFHLVKNNCAMFVSELLLFLTNKALPEEYLSNMRKNYETANSPLAKNPINLHMMYSAYLEFNPLEKPIFEAAPKIE